MKHHKFKGQPGEQCLYVSGSEENARQCRTAIDHPIHLTTPALPANLAEMAWSGHADAVLALLRTKRAYGTAWQDQGYMGNLARIFSKVSRLRNLLWKDDCGPDLQMQSEESVLDTLYDLSALCAFAINNIEEGNRWGKQ